MTFLHHTKDGRDGWSCYDAKLCCMVKSVRWVNSATAQWGKLVKLPHPPFLDEVTVQEERITIYPSQRLVVFNEIEDDDQADDGEAVSTIAPRSLEAA